MKKGTEGWKEEEKTRGEARKRTEIDWREEEREMRNNIHKIINMCLTQEQSIEASILYLSDDCG